MDNQLLVPRFPRAGDVLVPLLVSAGIFFLLGAALSPAHALGVPLYSDQPDPERAGGFRLRSPPRFHSRSSPAPRSGSLAETHAGEGVPYAFNEDSGGLHIGVSSPDRGVCRLLRPPHSRRHARSRTHQRTVEHGTQRLPQCRPLRPDDGRVNIDYVYLRAYDVERRHLLGGRHGDEHPNGAFSVPASVR